ncbi:MAG: hypothetical protein HC912_10085 [Saprospiraceae bacterium]|nr:hypothetical protein [Saprospiraceae bacterium]
MNADGSQDILIAGNFYSVKPEFGRYDANYGVWLQGNGKGDFQAIPAQYSGFRTTGEVRDLAEIKVKGRRYLLVAQSNEQLLVFDY